MPLVEIAVTVAGAFRSPKRIAVPANSLWVDTGTDLVRGDPWILSASGAWSNAEVPNLGPDGFSGYLYPNILLGTAALASLIGRIGNMMFPVGTLLQVTVPYTGRLFLSINDIPESFGDNQGLLAVVVR